MSGGPSGASTGFRSTDGGGHPGSSCVCRFAHWYPTGAGPAREHRQFRNDQNSDEVHGRVRHHARHDLLLSSSHLKRLDGRDKPQGDRGLPYAPMDYLQFGRLRTVG